VNGERRIDELQTIGENTKNVARPKIFSWIILAFALMLYSEGMPKEVRKCSIQSAIDSQGFTDFIQTCRIHIVAG